MDWIDRIDDKITRWRIRHSFNYRYYCIYEIKGPWNEYAKEKEIQRKKTQNEKQRRNYHLYD